MPSLELPHCALICRKAPVMTSKMVAIMMRMRSKMKMIKVMIITVRLLGPDCP